MSENTDAIENTPYTTEPGDDTETPTAEGDTSAEPTGTQEARGEAATLLSRLVDLGRRASHIHRKGGSPWGDPRRGQGRVLAILKLKPEISQRELSYLLDISKQSLAELLGKLEQNGFITREPSPTDRRVMLVRLTDAGKAAGQGRGRGDAIAADLLGTFTDEELERLSGYLARVIDALEQHIEENEPEDRRRRREEYRHLNEEFQRFGEEYGEFGPFRGGAGRRGHGRSPRGPEFRGREFDPRDEEFGPRGPRGPRPDGDPRPYGPWDERGPEGRGRRGGGRFGRDDERGCERHYRGGWYRGVSYRGC